MHHSEVVQVTNLRSEVSTRREEHVSVGDIRMDQRFWNKPDCSPRTSTESRSLQPRPMIERA